MVIINWYKLAQAQPVVSDTLPQSGIAWMDVEGNIYNTGTFDNSHSKWINRYMDFLNEKYDYKLTKPDPSQHRDNVFKLIDHGWSRIYGGDHFEIKSFSDTETLRKIGDELSKIYGPSTNVEIIIESRDERRVAQFNWQKYIREGENFSDFVRSHALNRW